MTRTVIYKNGVGTGYSGDIRHTTGSLYGAAGMLLGASIMAYVNSDSGKQDIKEIKKVFKEVNTWVASLFS